jgi:hypothetical protein
LGLSFRELDFSTKTQASGDILSIKIFYRGNSFYLCGQGMRAGVLACWRVLARAGVLVYLLQCIVIRCHPMSSDVIRCHPMSSDVIHSPLKSSVC